MYKIINDTIKVPLVGENNEFLFFNMTEKIKNNLKIIEKLGHLNLDGFITKDLDRRLFFENLIDEAIWSSDDTFVQRKSIKQIINGDYSPINLSQMKVYNNFEALELVVNNLDQILTKKFTSKIWMDLINKTVDKNFVLNNSKLLPINDNLNHNSLDGSYSRNQSAANLESLYSLLNTESNDMVIINACIMTYYFSVNQFYIIRYEQLARALIYKYLLASKYWSFKYTSISKSLYPNRKNLHEIINKCKTDNDITQYITLYTKVIVDALKSRKKESYIALMPKVIDDLFQDNISNFNNRQRKAIRLLYQDKIHLISNKIYKNHFKISYETARLDLNQLYNLGMIRRYKFEKQYRYRKKSLLELGVNTKNSSTNH